MTDTTGAVPWWLAERHRLATGHAVSRPAPEWAAGILRAHVPDFHPDAPVVAVWGSVVRVDEDECCRQCSQIGFRAEHGLIRWPCDAWLLATALLQGGSPAASQPSRAPGPQQR